MKTTTAEKPATHSSAPIAIRTQWEQQVLADLAGLRDCSMQKAKDIAQSQLFVANQAWVKGFCPKTTAKAIDISAPPQ